MKLVAVFPQYKDGNKDKLLSDINIEVDYDPEERVVTEVKRVWAYCYRFRTIIEMTDFFDTFSKSLDNIIDHFDWWELFCDAKEEKRRRVA